MKKLQCIIHAPSSNTLLIKQKVTKALIEKTSNLDVSILNPFEAKAKDILEADGLLLGTTENLASMAGATKDFFDRTYYDLLGKKEGLPIVIWVRAGHDGTGTVKQLTGIIAGLRWKLVQQVLVCHGEWSKRFIDECTELGLGLAIGLESNVY